MKFRIEVERMPDGEWRGELYHSDRFSPMFRTKLSPTSSEALAMIGDLLRLMSMDIMLANPDATVVATQRILDQIEAGRVYRNR